MSSNSKIDDQKRQIMEEWTMEQESLQQRVDEIAKDLSNALLSRDNQKQFIADDQQKLSSACQTLLKWQDSVCAQKPKSNVESE